MTVTHTLFEFQIHDTLDFLIRHKHLAKGQRNDSKRTVNRKKEERAAKKRPPPTRKTGKTAK
jgi:hypothetical protein